MRADFARRFKPQGRFELIFEQLFAAVRFVVVILVAKHDAEPVIEQLNAARVHRAVGLRSATTDSLQ